MRIVRDTRERKPWSFDDFNVSVIDRKLDTGDYTIDGYDNVFSVDRKSIDDLVGSLNPASGRDRFRRELKRADKMYRFAVVVEGARRKIETEQYYSKIHPNVILGTIDSWTEAYNVEFIFCLDRREAQLTTLNLLTEWRDQFDRLTR